MTNGPSLEDDADLFLYFIYIYMYISYVLLVLGFHPANKLYPIVWLMKKSYHWCSLRSLI